MNFLAHLFLAADTPAAKIGSVLPDLVRGKGRKEAMNAAPPAMLEAIRQHHRIDAYTDAHAVVARSKARLRERHGHYAPILVDVFYDHHLARDWQHHRMLGGHATPDTLPAFVARVHDAFRSHPHLLPGDMRYPIDRLIEQNWLGSYATIDGIETALRRMSVRLSARFEREVKLESAVDDLARHDAEFADDFRVFFPQLAAHAPATSRTAPTTPEATPAMRV